MPVLKFLIRNNSLIEHLILLFFKYNDTKIKCHKIKIKVQLNNDLRRLLF